MRPYRSELSGPPIVNLDLTINSGQVFVWRKDRGFWYGINGQNVLKCDSTGVVKSFCRDKTDFFKTRENIHDITESISRDPTVKEAVARYSGLRLPRQDPFQCCVTFIASSNSSIQKIRSCLEKLCARFGEEVSFDGMKFCLFPEPDVVARASASSIRKCGLGYRSEYVREAASMITDRIIDFENIRGTRYRNAREKLRAIPGVGNKVADCILLFSLDMPEAFPLDRWILKVLQRHYPGRFGIEGTLTDKRYNTTHDKIVSHFGPYAGYAQQFLFRMERDDSGRKWL